MPRGIARGQALGQTAFSVIARSSEVRDELVLVIAKRQLIVRRGKLVLELRDSRIRRLELLD